MLVTEIFNAPSSDKRWTATVQELIDKHQLTSNDGSYATVLSREDKNHVYRIWTNDKGYERWLKYALMHQSDPHIVKVLSRVRTIPTKFKGLPIDVKVKFIKLEKLKGLEIDTPPKYRRWGVQTIADALASFVDPSPRESSKVLQFIESEKSFFDTCRKLSKDLPVNDLNTDNIMLRGDTLVVVDPVSER